MYLVRYENCIPVKGYNRSTICDVQRHALKLIPNSLYEILQDHNGKTVEAIKAHFDHQYDETIEEYVAFLIENEYAFFTDHPEWFPALSDDWKSPLSITNAILDRDATSDYDLLACLEELSQMRCRHLQIRSYDEWSFTELEEALNYLKASDSPIISVEVLLKYEPKLEDESIEHLIFHYPRLLRVMIHSSFQDENRKLEVHEQAYIIHTTKTIDSSLHCGVIHRDYFTVNMSMFTESKHFNSCLNRKISVDSQGEIKNCPSMAASFGQVGEVSLESALDHPEFKKLWSTTKDEIDSCKQCEFRYVCTDCRAFVENPADAYSKPLKCGYDPITNEWTEWSTHPMKQAAIESYGLKSFRKMQSI